MSDKKVELSVELITLADHVIQSRDSKLSIIGLFDRFNLAKTPFKWPRMFVVIVLKGSKESTYSVSVKIVRPDGRTIYGQEGNLKTGDNGKTNLFVELNGFPLETFGDYVVEVYSGKAKIEKFKFSVEKSKGGSNGKRKSSTLTN